MSLANAAYGASLTWIDAGHEASRIRCWSRFSGRHPGRWTSEATKRRSDARLGVDPLYSKLFSDAFPRGTRAMNLGNVRKAIASFERTIVSGDSPYDRLVWKDDRDALSEPARRGMALFFSESPRLLEVPRGIHVFGACRLGGRAARRAHFPRQRSRRAVPRADLRNVAVTAPYMHDGRFSTLEDVVDHYATGGTTSPGRSPLVRGFAVTAAEKARSGRVPEESDRTRAFLTTRGSLGSARGRRANRPAEPLIARRRGRFRLR